MEEKEEIKQSPPQDQNKVKPDKQGETNKEDKVAQMLEATQLQKDTTEEKHESETEVKFDKQEIAGG
ncbi:unnamed protein product, partial [Ilex paraguariensis]